LENVFVSAVAKALVAWAVLTFAVAKSAAADETACAYTCNKCTEDATLLQDWPNLSFFAAANRSVRNERKSTPRVVFIGDSITAILPSELLRRVSRAAINRGINRQTSSQVLLRFRSDVIQLKPSLVVILAGSNDIAGITGPTPLSVIQGNLSSMSEIAVANGVRVAFSSILPVLNRPERSNAQIQVLNSWIRRFCRTHGFTYIDYFSALSDENGNLRSELSEDGLHPNIAGYLLMSRIARRAVSKANL
jgi:lysophospholipase L1-like esterase